MLLPWSLSNFKSYCTKVKLLFSEKCTTTCTLLSWLFIRLWPTKHPFFHRSREISSVRHGRVGAQKNLSLSKYKNGTSDLETCIQMEKELWILKSFMIVVEGLIKPLGYQKKKKKKKKRIDVLHQLSQRQIQNPVKHLR